MKKKILLSTLALSMACSTMAALPFADQGVLKKAGVVRTAEASAASDVLDAITTRISNIYSADAEAESKAEAVVALINADANKAEVMDIINTALSNLPNQPQQDEEVYQLLKSAAKIAFGEVSEVGKFRRGGDHFNTMKAIDSTITSADVEGFGNALFAELVNEARIASLMNVVGNGSLKDALETHLQQSLNAVLTSHSTNKVVGLINSSKLTAADLTKVYNLVVGSNSDAYKEAFNAIIPAFAKAELSAVDVYNVDANNGAYLALKMNATDSYSTQLSALLTKYAATISKKVQWSVAGNANLSVDANGKLSVLNNPTSGPISGTVTATVYGADKEQLVIVDNQAITVNYTQTATDGGSSGGGASTPAGLPNYIKLNQETIAQLKGLRAELAGALTTEAKQATLNKIQQLFNQYVEAAGTINVNGFVTDKEDAAVLSMTQDHTRELMKEVEKQLQSMVEYFKLASEDLKVPTFVITLDLGKTKSDNYDISLNQGLMEQMKSYDIGYVRVKNQGGFITKLAVDLIQEAAKWTVKMNGTVPSLTNVPVVASAVYDVNFTAPATWAAGSVFVNVPLNSDFALPKHALQVATIDNQVASRFTANNGAYEYELTQAQTSVAITGRDANFKDISKVEGWAGAQIDFVASLGIMDGVGNNNFDPAQNVTRGQLAKMFVQAFELTQQGANRQFSDVNSTAWHADFVNIVVQQGLMNTFNDGSFKPNAEMSRAEIAAVAARAMKNKYGWEEVTNVDEILSAFKDADKIHPSLRQDVALAVKHNLMLGNNGQFNPTATADRAQAAVIFYRLLQN